MDSSTGKKSTAGLLLGICVWNLIVSIDSTALSTALPTIAHDLQASSTQAFWCGTSFVLCSAAFQPVIASFSDAFGRRSMTLLSLILFTIGTIVCGVAKHVAVLILGRCIQGTGGGGLLTMTYVLMADNFDLTQRHKAVSVVSLTWLVGPVLGPILAGAFTEKVSWRWVFWFNLPFCALAFAIVIFLVSSPYRSPYKGLQRIQVVDWFGSVVFVASVTSFLLAISWGGTMFAWSSVHTVLPLVSGIVGLAFWIFYSIKITSHAIIPFEIMNDRTALIGFFGNLVHGICFFGVVYYMPLYYQAVKLYSPIISGVGSLPICLVAGPFAAIVGIAIAKTHLIKPYAVVGWIVLAMAMGLLTLLQPETKVAQWIFLAVPTGLGLGALYPALALATQAACEVSDKTFEEIEKTKSLAAALNPFFRTIGQTLGIVISQAAFINALKAHLGASSALDATSMLEVIKSLPPRSPERLFIIQSFSNSLRHVWWTLFALAAVMLILTLATKDVDLSAAPSECSSISDVESCEKQPVSSEPPTKSRRKFSLFGLSDVFSDGFHQGLFEGLHRASVSRVPMVQHDIRRNSTSRRASNARHGSVCLTASVNPNSTLPTSSVKQHNHTKQVSIVQEECEKSLEVEEEAATIKGKFNTHIFVKELE